MNVSPRNSGTLRLESSDDLSEPTGYPSFIDCFSRNEPVTITASPEAGFQFDHWEFNYWPPEDLGPPKIYLNERSDGETNPLSFINSYLLNDGYADDYDADRTIIAYFTTSSSSSLPVAPKNTSATDGTETGKVVISWDSSSGANSYTIFRSDSSSGQKTIGSTSQTAYEDTTVFQDNKYYYWIKAVNQYGSSAYSSYDTGYAYVDDQEPPTPPTLPGYESEAVTPAEAKQMLDTDRDVIIVDVSMPNDYESDHILCAFNMTWNSMFDYLDYKSITGYEDFPVLIYDQDATTSALAADYLAEKGFSSVYHMTDGLQQWMASGWETVDSGQPYECSLPPMALAGQDIGINENEPFSLDGSGSKAADSQSLTYAWDQVQGTTADIIDATSAQARFTSPYVQESGEKLIFHLTVTDSKNNKDTDSVSIDVAWQNSAPIADAGNFQSVAEGDTVILSASGSSDRDNGISTYQWKQISGNEAELKYSTSEIARFTAPNIDTDEAELVFELTVTDNGGLSDTDQVTILVSDNNAPPEANAGPDQTVSETQLVQLDGSGSEDTDDGIKTYSWTQIGTGPTVQLSSHSDVQPTFTAPEVGEGSIIIEFQLIVTDQSGAQSTGPDEVRITVKDAGDPPEADAGTDQNPVYEGRRVSMDGSASADGDGEITAYQWTQVSGPDVSLIGANSATPEFTVPDLDEESVQFVFQVMVIDDTGLNGTDQVKIVAAKALMPPTADAGDGQEVKEGSPVILDGSNSLDPDDGITLYSWKQTGGDPAAELSDSSAIKPEFIAPDVKKDTILTFELTVTDYKGNEDTDEVEIRVLKNSDSDSSCFISTLE